jgi:2-iminobutanoate/2-iminopropanoate deaminase
MHTVESSKAPKPVGPYAQATIAHHFLYTAGQIGLDPATGQIVNGGVGPQTQRALANLTAVLAERQLTWSDVVKTTVYLTNMADFEVMNEAYAKVMGSARPARSTVAVAALPRGAAVEIDAVAAMKKEPGSEHEAHA